MSTLTTTTVRDAVYTELVLSGMPAEVREAEDLGMHHRRDEGTRRGSGR